MHVEIVIAFRHSRSDGVLFASHYIWFRQKNLEKERKYGVKQYLFLFFGGYKIHVCEQELVLLVWNFPCKLHSIVTSKASSDLLEHRMLHRFVTSSRTLVPKSNLFASRGFCRRSLPLKTHDAHCRLLRNYCLRRSCILQLYNKSNLGIYMEFSFS